MFITFHSIPFHRCGGLQKKKIHFGFVFIFHIIENVSKRLKNYPIQIVWPLFVAMLMIRAKINKSDVVRNRLFISMCRRIKLLLLLLAFVRLNIIISVVGSNSVWNSFGLSNIYIVSYSLLFLKHCSYHHIYTNYTTKHMLTTAQRNAHNNYQHSALCIWACA